MVEADLGGWLSVVGVVLEEELIQRILAEAESALAWHMTEAGQDASDSPAHVITGTSP